MQETILKLANRKDLSETGGGHNQKGVEFQRYWAVLHLLSLEETSGSDYVLLFESFQDVAQVDSSQSPQAIRIFQVKKKDRKEWAWKELTGLPAPKSKRAKPSLEKLQASPLGKLMHALQECGELATEAVFISNAGCDIPLRDGGNFATSMPTNLGSLHDDYFQMLTPLFSDAEKKVDLGKVMIEKVGLPPDAPKTFLIGLAHEFLRDRSPSHAGQAATLVDTLITKIAPLGAKTAKCHTYDQLISERGFSHSDFTKVIGALETVPDVVEFSKDFLDELRREGMPLFERVAVDAALAQIYRNQLLAEDGTDESLLADCLKWVQSNTFVPPLWEKLKHCAREVAKHHPERRKVEIYAATLIQGIKCAVQASESL